MGDATVSDILNALLIEEQTSLAERLIESTLFVSRLSVQGSIAVRRIAGISREHCQWLTQRILESGSAPWPPQPDVRSGDLHFQDLAFAVSRLIADIERRIKHYDQAAERLREAPQAVALIAKIQERYRSALAGLRETADHMSHRAVS